MPDELTLDPESFDTLPKWIFHFGSLLATIGIVAGLLGVVSPTKFFSDFPTFTQWSDIFYVTTGWGIRNLAMGGVMLFTPWLRMSGAIASTAKTVTIVCLAMRDAIASIVATALTRS